LALNAPHTNPEEAGFWVVPVPYERTTTFQRGTAFGPAAILEASGQVEFHDEELGVQPLRAGIHTAAPFVVEETPEPFCRRLEAAYADWCHDDRVVAVLGGEHTVTVGPVRALANRWPGLGVLQIDAHADLRDSYEGSAFSHACVARRLVEVTPVVQVGIRALSGPEAKFLRETSRVQAFPAHALPDDVSRRVADALPERVYVTLDIDGLDPSEAPGTGTPEPGGLRYREILDLLREVCRTRRVVGFDLVEVRPLEGSAVTEFLAARLVYKLMGYIATRGGTEEPDWQWPEVAEE
jgi:agmatinase